MLRNFFSPCESWRSGSVLDVCFQIAYILGRPALTLSTFLWRPGDRLGMLYQLGHFRVSFGRWCIQHLPNWQMPCIQHLPNWQMLYSASAKLVDAVYLASVKLADTVYTSSPRLADAVFSIRRLPIGRYRVFSISQHLPNWQILCSASPTLAVAVFIEVVAVTVVSCSWLNLLWTFH